MSGYITKDLFLKSFACHTLGWELHHNPSTEPLSLHDKFTIEEGIEIGRRARTLYPGILVSGDNISAAKTTAKLIKDQNCSAIFEATFLSDDLIAKADILLRENNGWKVVEVKSSTNEKPELVDDLAYTTMAAKKAGLKVSSCALMLVSKDYRLGMGNEKLFKKVDCTEKVLERAEEFGNSTQGIVKDLNSDKKPESKLRWVCKKCPIFGDCCGVGIDDHIFELPRIKEKKFCRLRDMNVVSIRDIPAGFDLSKTQIPVWEAVRKGGPVVDEQGLKGALGKINYPAYYLDFETVTTALPLYENIAPYAQIPTQYSIHKCSAPGQIEEHYEYLADPGKDCRRELSENLIRDCESMGTIFSYSTFEKTVIKGLSELFPDLEEKLNGLIKRIIDLKAILTNYYAPRFHGSYSIKDVLPVMITDPELSYDNMEVSNGSDAIAVYAGMARGQYTAGQAEQIKKDLLAYCKLDTMAMVRLHEKLFSRQ